ncbi:MAG: PEP/pyruvate-binding domain-containing protein, partial [Anaerolineales bacterium]|nr:PEP/pyruvate-binding domain-containing protein [Anaerolineales bacterium]
MTYTIPLSELDKTNIRSAGGKGANLGELTAAGFPVPPGFVLTTAAYDAFVEANKAREKILEIAGQAPPYDPESGIAASEAIGALFQDGEIPEEVEDELVSAYNGLAEGGSEPVAVRSSATAEDLPQASFAGQQETFLNVLGQEALMAAVRKCWASLWTARAIIYRRRHAIDPSKLSLAVVIQRLVPAEAAGILFTANPLDGAREQAVVNGAWGLGEAIVGGLVTPDTFIVDKAERRVMGREIAVKSVMTVSSPSGTEEQPVPAELQNQPALDRALALELARLGSRI